MLGLDNYFVVSCVHVPSHPYFQSLFEHIIQPPPHLADGWNSNVPTRLQKISGQLEKRTQSLFSIRTLMVEVNTIPFYLDSQQASNQRASICIGESWDHPHMDMEETRCPNGIQKYLTERSWGHE